MIYGINALWPLSFMNRIWDWDKTICCNMWSGCDWKVEIRHTRILSKCSPKTILLYRSFLKIYMYIFHLYICYTEVQLKWEVQMLWGYFCLQIWTSTPIHARAWKEKALAGYNSQQIPTSNNIHKMLIIIISLIWKHFVIISYLYKIPTINNQRNRDIRQTHADILTA